MKKIIIGLALVISSVSSAESILAPDYICHGDNGLQYNFFASSFSEIQIYDKNGNSKGGIDSIRYEIHQLEDLLARVSVVVVDEDEETVAEFGYVQGDKFAIGTINDYINEDRLVNIKCNLEK